MVVYANLTPNESVVYRGNPKVMLRPTPILASVTQKTGSQTCKRVHRTGMPTGKYQTLQLGLPTLSQMSILMQVVVFSTLY